MQGAVRDEESVEKTEWEEHRIYCAAGVCLRGRGERWCCCFLSWCSFSTSLHKVKLCRAATEAILLPQWLCTASVIASINKVFKEFIYYCSAAASKVKCDAAEWKLNERSEVYVSKRKVNRGCFSKEGLGLTVGQGYKKKISQRWQRPAKEEERLLWELMFDHQTSATVAAFVHRNQITHVLTWNEWTAKLLAWVDDLELNAWATERLPRGFLEVEPLRLRSQQNLMHQWPAITTCGHRGSWKPKSNLLLQRIS